LGGCGAVQAVQVDPRNTLALSGGIANAIVNQEAADGKVQVAKSQIRFTDILMFIDSQYQK
jgi:methyl coenzyme M reductase beta subunit